MSQAGAMAALKDQAYLADVQRQVAEGRDVLYDIARSNGLSPLPSATNFVTMDTGRDSAFARLLLAELGERDIFIRMPGAPPLDTCIRVSTSTPEDMALFRAALPRALEATQIRTSTEIRPIIM